jgi:hypothetical protein
MSQSVRPPETLRYRLVQPLNRAVRQLRDAEDIARIEMSHMPTADRIRSIYEQIAADLLNGTTTVPPIAQRLRESEARCGRLATALSDAGVPDERLQELWG